MIHCAFTLDYEIYGSGEGALQDLVLAPTARLADLFVSRDVRFVAFVEALEFAKIEAAGTDKGSSAVRAQVRELHRAGFEIALHLHPQWSRARLAAGRWELDYTEYNLCVLSRQRIAAIVDNGLAWLSSAVGDHGFHPLAFRAGNWLFQPTARAAEILAARGLRIDSSVFKGGVQHQHGLDYRPSLRHGAYWHFGSDVNVPDAGGALIEVPIFAEMVPPWRMVTKKRVALQRKSLASAPRARDRLHRAWDLLRLRQPLKFDFCRMTYDELVRMTETLIEQDQVDPQSYRPFVAIGHSKDLWDFETIERFLAFLQERAIPVVTFPAIIAEIERRRAPAGAAA